MSTTVSGQVIPNPRMVAIRAVFSALFDAVDTIDSWDEGRWGDLIAAFNATGRLVFGWSRLESSESDIFGALDDIAAQLEGTKTAMELTARDTRIVLHQLHEALDPMLPDEPTEPEPDPPLLKEPEPVAPEPTPTTPERAVPEPPAEAKNSTNQKGHRYDLKGMLAQLRRSDSISDAALALGIKYTTLYMRVTTLRDRGDLPADLIGKFGLLTPSPVLVDESFEERRKRAAKEAADRTWRERHPETA